MYYIFKIPIIKQQQTLFDHSNRVDATKSIEVGIIYCSYPSHPHPTPKPKTQLNHYSKFYVNSR